MNQTIKIFLASSSELVEDRRAFEIFIGRQNNLLIKKGVFLELVIWENFLDAMSSTRLQNEYNEAIRKCDIFVMLFFTKVGKYTAEEFKVAFDTFKATGKPLIYTYFKDANINIGAISEQIMSMLNFKKELSDMGHFYTSYQNQEGLLFHFSQQLDKLTENGFIPSGNTLKSSPPAEEPTFKKGHVLYQVPKKMQLLKETTCRVRIAFDKILLTKEFEVDDDTSVKSGIRVSDYMEVKIIDPTENEAFQIRTNDELVQFVGLDDFTEWRFYVKPLLSGTHPLELKVSIIVLINGKEVKREKSFDENIVIVTEEVEEDLQFVKAMDVKILPDKTIRESISRGKGFGFEDMDDLSKARGEELLAGMIDVKRSETDSSFDDLFSKSMEENFDDEEEKEIEKIPSKKTPKKEKVNLKTIKKQLKQAVAEDLGEALEKVGNVLLDDSRQFNLLIGLKSRFRRNRKEEANGRISFENAKREYAQITHALQYLIDELEESDIEPSAFSA